jgi:hypothetical protein
MGHPVPAQFPSQLDRRNCGQLCRCRPDQTYRCERPTTINIPLAAEQIAAQHRRIAKLIGRAEAASSWTHRLLHAPHPAERRPSEWRLGQHRSHPGPKLRSVADTPTASVTATNWGIAREAGYTMRVNARPDTNLEVRIGNQPVRRIEFHNQYEYGIFDDHGYALDPTVTYPNRESAEHSLRYLLDRAEADPERTYTILVRPTPKCWTTLPPDSEG